MKLQKMFEAINASELFACHDFTYLEPKRLALFFANTKRNLSIIVWGGKQGKTPESVEIEWVKENLSPINEAMKDARNRVRKIAGNTGKGAIGQVGIGRTGRGTIRGIDLKSLKKTAINECLFSFIEERSQAWENAVEFHHGKLDTLYGVNEAGKFFLAPELEKIAIAVLLKVEGVKSAKSLESWLPSTLTSEERENRIGARLAKERDLRLKVIESQETISKAQGSHVDTVHPTPATVESVALKNSKVALVQMVKAKGINVPRNASKIQLAALLAA